LRGNLPQPAFSVNSAEFEHFSRNFGDFRGLFNKCNGTSTKPAQNALTPVYGKKAWIPKPAVERLKEDNENPFDYFVSYWRSSRFVPSPRIS
jgi:hypothetical protein